MNRPRLTATVLALGLFSASIQSAFAELPEIVVYDEAKQADFGDGKSTDEPAVTLEKDGIHLLQGTGIDAIDDADKFVFEVKGEKKFDFCLICDAAEFKKLYSVDDEGKTTEIAFGSTNPRYGVDANISKEDLPPGKYFVEMYFGPEAAVGQWFAKIAIGERDKEKQPLCSPPQEPTTAEKMQAVDWPGAISIYHGHNWGDDKSYIKAIKAAGYRATGAAEWQIEEVAEQGLKAYVFIWPHESATIPVKHKDSQEVLCYYLSDRIPPAKWQSWASLEKMCYQGDPKHPAVFTMRGLWGGIENFPPVVKGRAMEYYHYHWDGNRSPGSHFALLEEYRKTSLANGDVPVCRIVEVRPEDMRKTRQTVYTCLAYGVRGYRMGGGIFDVEKRDDQGVPTLNDFGKEIQALNAAINAYSPIFKSNHCTAVYHTTPLPAGCPETPKESWVNLTGEELLVGVFDAMPTETDNAEADQSESRYLLVANRDAFGKRKGEVVLSGEFTISRLNKDSGKWTDVVAESANGKTKFAVELIDGSGDLYRVSQRH